MLYAWIGFLKPDAGPVPQAVQERVNDFVAQPLIKIHSFGPLHDEAGDRAGMLMIFEHVSREAAQRFVDDSPYLQAGLYQDHRLYEYANEAG